jgi:hypothetical protein
MSLIYWGSPRLHFSGRLWFCSANGPHIAKEVSARSAQYGSTTVRKFKSNIYRTSWIVSLLTVSLISVSQVKRKNDRPTQKYKTQVKEGMIVRLKVRCTIKPRRDEPNTRDASEKLCVCSRCIPNHSAAHATSALHYTARFCGLAQRKKERPWMR